MVLVSKIIADGQKRKADELVASETAPPVNGEVERPTFFGEFPVAPANWPGLNVEEAIASTGHNQSPLEIGGNAHPETDQVSLEEAVRAIGERRLRRRGKWVNLLSETLGLRTGTLGKFLHGRWTPDLPKQGSKLSSFMALFPNGVRLSCHGEIEVSRGSDVGVAGDSGATTVLPFAGFDFPDGEVLAVPELVCKLMAYSVFRKRDGSLLSALRYRALEWFRENRVSPIDTARLMAGSVALGFMISVQEESARQILSSDGVEGAACGPYVSQRSFVELAT
jgi:hypothetical protein